tara:strand:- start:698 stop:1027 length:330 start_codon:yes stop_codon:yes gene_type:complete
MPTKGPPEASQQPAATRRLPGPPRRAAALGAAICVSLLLSFHAQGNNPQRAIEKLEKCSAEERSGGRCVKILKRQPSGDGKQRIKAQLRNGRIIWYEYDRKTGKVRRVN